MPESLVDMGKDQIEEALKMKHVQTNVLQKKAHARLAKGKEVQRMIHTSGQMQCEDKVCATTTTTTSNLPAHSIDYLARGFRGSDATGRKDEAHLLGSISEVRGDRPDRRYMATGEVLGDRQHFGADQERPGNGQTTCGFRSESAHNRPTSYTSDSRCASCRCH